MYPNDTWTCTNCAMTYEGPAYLYCYQCGQARPSRPITIDERLERLETAMSIVLEILKKDEDA